MQKGVHKIEKTSLSGGAAAFLGAGLGAGSCASYVAYGLRIRSELALPELVKAGGVADVSIRFGSVDTHQSESSEDGLLWATEDEVCLVFPELAGAFLIREGREIVADPIPGADERWVRAVILGPGMGTLLYQRGWLTLHASAVSVGGRAVAFMADKGQGKSTMAAAMCARGHRLIADDVTALKSEGSRPVVSPPGYPLLRLWPSAVAAIGENPDTLPPIEPNGTTVNRRGLRASLELSSKPLPLGCIYVLDQGDALEIEPLQSQDALVEMIRNTYGRKLFQVVRRSSHLHQCTNVVSSVPVRRLERPRSLAALSDVARLVEVDLAQTSSGVQK